MKIKIMEEKTNKLMKREEVKFEILHEGEPTPSRDKTREEVSKKLKADSKLTVVEYISSLYGHGKSIGKVHVYKKREEMLENEPKHLLIRNKHLKTGKQEPEEEGKKSEK